jgi:hypothetical protein
MGAPALSCALGITSTEATSPGKGAATVDSIFMLSRTATGSPSASTSPGWTRTDTTKAGQSARTTPPSSRIMRCDDPLTTTRNIVPCVTATTR